MAFKRGRFVYPSDDISLIFDASDFDALEETVEDLAAYIRRWGPALELAKRVAIRDMKKRFKTQTAPDGMEWAELDPDYAKRKVKAVGFTHPILTAEGTLKEAATSDDAFDVNVTTGTVSFDTSGLPDYWAVHEFGSEDFGMFFHPSFPLSGLPGKASTEFSGEAGQNVPPRPFIGLSQEASTEVFESIDAWFSVGVEQARRQYGISSQGTLQHRTRGRFGPKVII